MKPATQPTKNGLSPERTCEIVGRTLDVEEVQQGMHLGAIHATAATALGYGGTMNSRTLLMRAGA